MSGDVQPKKRKDKKRKKADQEYHIQRIQILEEEDIGTPSPPMVVNNSDNLDNITIHMNKERATGGHWCAKIIFFALLSVLIAIVGVIIFEYRGSTEVDVPIESSRWAMIFDGWVDDTLPTHVVQDTSKEEEEDEEEDHDHDHGEKEEEEDDHDEDNESKTVEESVEEEKESNEIDDGVSREADDEEDEEDGDDDDDEDEENSEEEEEIEENILYIEESEEQNDNDEPLEEADESEEQKTVFDEEEDDNDLLNDDDEMSFEILDVVITHDIEDSSEPLEEIEGEDEIEDVTINDPVGMNAEDDNDDDENKNQENQEDEPSSVAVKFGVGVALVVAAHFVLVRRWRNADDFEDDVILTENISPELSSRETIFSSKSLDENVDILNDNKNKLEEKLNKINNEKFVGSKNSEDDNDQQSGTEEELTTYDDTGEDEDDDEEEGDEELEESDNEIIHVDDSDLVAKLEAKYGKLPASKQTEEEEDEDEDEIDDEEYEDDDEEDITRDDSEEEEEDSESEQLNDLKHTKGATTSGTSKADLKNSQGSSSQQKKTDGRQEQPVDIMNFDDIEVQEEVENWLMRDFDN